MSRSRVIVFVAFSLSFPTLAAARDETPAGYFQSSRFHAIQGFEKNASRTHSPPTAQLVAKNGTRLSSLPLSFVENCGQWNTRARFVARRGGMLARAEWDAMNLQFKTRDADGNERRVSVRLAFEDALETVTIEGEEQESGVHNFFLGKDPGKWRAQVPAYRKILYRGLYPGIDMRVREEAPQLEYDILLAPWANLDQLVIRCEGIDGLMIEADGALVMETTLGPIRQKHPATWHELPSGEHVPVECRYRLVDETRFGFEVIDRDPSLVLVIDPGLEWSTFVGGLDVDRVWDLAVDALSGDVIATGEVNSLDFPTTAGAYDEDHNGGPDAFVFRMAAGGDALVWSTYLGADGVDIAYAMVLAGSGEITVAGRSDSPLFPTTSGAYDTSHNGTDDAFVTRLDANGGSLIYSTYLGGIDSDFAVDLVLDDLSGEVLLVGYTESADFPTTAGAFDTTLGGIRDAFVTRLDADGSDLVFSTFLGGSNAEGPDPDMLDPLGVPEGGIALAPSGAASVTGHTESSDFPTTVGAYDRSYNGGTDAFVTQLNVTGSALLYSTFLGAGYQDFAFRLDLDEVGNAIVCGQTYSSDFPTTHGAYDRSFNAPYHRSDGFVARLDPIGASLLYSTFLGGNGQDGLLDLDLHDSGDVVVIGGTNASDFPTTRGCFDPSHNGDYDVVLCRLSMAGQDTLDLVYSTFLGQGDFDVGQAVFVRGDEVTLGGSTFSPDFPTTQGCFQPNFGGLADGYISRFEELTAGVQGSRPEVGAIEQRVRLQAPSPNPAFGRVLYDIDLAREARIRVDVFDIRGRPVERLIDRNLQAGSHRLTWDLDDGLRAGAYYLRLTADSGTETRKIVIVR